MENSSVTKKRPYQRPTLIPLEPGSAAEQLLAKTKANRGVWTKPMLTALETGVKGGRWHTLIDKVFSRRNLADAARRVIDKREPPGVDHVNVDLFESRLAEELDTLEELLRTDAYCPQQILRMGIHKPDSKEQQLLGIPTVRDRVVQTALLQVIEPIFDHTFHESNCGFRDGRGLQDALRQVEHLLTEGSVYVVDAALKSCFYTISHDRLLDLVREAIADSRVLRLIEMFLRQGILEDLSTWVPEVVAPPGAVISPLLANIYLNPLDHLVAEAGFPMVRFADEFVILCRRADEAATALAHVRKWVAANNLTLHSTKTNIVNAQTECFEFLGYGFEVQGGDSASAEDKRGSAR
jgi:RNA-directed DNA polymerase